MTDQAKFGTLHALHKRTLTEGISGAERKVFVGYAVEILQKLQKEFPDANRANLLRLLRTVMSNMKLADDESNPNFKRTAPLYPKKWDKSLFADMKNTGAKPMWNDMLDAAHETVFKQALKKANIMESADDGEEYQAFFKKILTKFGVSSPTELDDDKKKEFYDYIDANWTSDDEEMGIDEVLGEGATRVIKIDGVKVRTRFDKDKKIATVFIKDVAIGTVRIDTSKMMFTAKSPENKVIMRVPSTNNNDFAVAVKAVVDAAGGVVEVLGEGMGRQYKIGNTKIKIEFDANDKDKIRVSVAGKNIGYVVTDENKMMFTAMSPSNKVIMRVPAKKHNDFDIAAKSLIDAAGIVSEMEDEIDDPTTDRIEKKKMTSAQKEYQAFFKKMLRKFGVESPGELDDEKKKQFYDEVDAGWNTPAEAGKDGIKESRSLASILLGESDEKDTVDKKEPADDKAADITISDRNDDEENELTIEFPEGVYLAIELETNEDFEQIKVQAQKLYQQGMNPIEIAQTFAKDYNASDWEISDIASLGDDDDDIKESFIVTR